MHVHVRPGELLDLGGYNAFGDPVNTAFKLAEDIAGPGSILIQEKTFVKLCEGREDEEKAALFGFEQVLTEISNVKINHRAINWSSERVQAVQTLLKVEVIEPQTETVALLWERALEAHARGEIAQAAAADAAVAERNPLTKGESTQSLNGDAQSFMVYKRDFGSPRAPAPGAAEEEDGGGGDKVHSLIKTSTLSKFPGSF